MSKYEELSIERKKLQKEGLIPEWYITPGYQMFKEKYEYEVEGGNVKGQFERIAKTAAKHLSKINLEEVAYDKFFNLLWRGWLSPSTPVLANMGTSRGLPVSCAGGVIHDSIDGFYSALRECAILSKQGFGTSSYLGYIRPRGSSISVGGKADGVVPVFKKFVQMTRDVSQCSIRRGAWAGYLPVEHDDFDELVDYIYNNPDDANIGWCISDSFINKLNNNSYEETRRYQKILKLKMVTGKGYLFFIDRANRHSPEIYKKNNLSIKASNLCCEISLFSDFQHSFSCVLSNMNLDKYDEWKDTDSVYWATIFLDCVIEEFLEKARKISGLENIVRFTEKGRAIGLGVCGLHTYMQNNSIIFDSLECQFKMVEMFKYMEQETKKASKYLAEQLGEPEWCKGFNTRNTHNMACPPTKSTSLLMAGVSEGINPNPSNTYIQQTAAGEIDRINPSLVKIMKDRNKFTTEEISKIVDDEGSVQKVDWLNEHEKKVFKTAFEIDQSVLLRYAALRNKHVDQWQSVNLFIPSDSPEEYISELHEDMFNNENILGSYYIYSKSGYSHSNKIKTCEACQ